MMIRQIWHRLFLEERPSIGLSLFRIFAAIAVGGFVLPTFVPIEDNYLSTAFKTINTNFFPVWFIELVQKSPDILVVVLAWVFTIAWLCFLIGLFSQISCIVMMAGCYYFYALNHLAMAHALTWDILLVTLFLLCLTPYHGDYFSVDALRRRDSEAYRRPRPFFLQRLLQMQIAFTYFYTGLYKVTAEGNWLTGNPIYYLMNRPSGDVMKFFILKEPLAQHPQLCYWIGILIVTIELLMPFLLWWPRTRVSAIYLGFVFHVTLILTMDIPAIFFFLFPAQLLLFINPKEVLAWIENKRQVNQKAPRSKLIFDGNCGFCQDSVVTLKIMDLFSAVEYVDFQTHPDLTVLHSSLTKEKAASQLHLIEPSGKLFGGFQVFQRLCLSMPMLYPAILIFYFPGASLAGPVVYKFIAKNRYLFHSNKTCKNNSCSLH